MINEDLLAVLDMSEEEQRKWVHFTLYDYYRGYTDSPLIQTEHILADLAFRLRDEMCKEIGGCEKYYAGLEAIYKYRGIKKQCQSFYAFLTYRLQPIDMIIAALIA